MSYDFATAKVCPHTVLFENVALDETATFFRFNRPISNNAVSVSVDGVDIPQAGLFSSARMVFSKKEPYKIMPGVSDKILLKIGSDIPVVVTLPTGFAVSAAQLAAGMNRAVPSLSFIVENGVVVATNSVPTKGDAFSAPDPRWTDRTSSHPDTLRILGGLAAIGVPPGRVASGRRIFPSWIITKNVNSFTNDTILLFDFPIPNSNPVVQVSYQVPVSACRRCFSTYVEYDYTVLNGSFETVSNTDLLTQEFDKFIFTRKGSHWKWPWLGSALADRIGGKSSTIVGSMDAMITMDVTQAFSVYQDIKRQQKFTFPQQRISDSEFPASIVNVSAHVDKNDPTIVTLSMSVVSQSRISVPITRTVDVPVLTSITGDSGFILRA